MQVRARATAAAALALALAALAMGRPFVELRVRERLEGEARRRGLVLELDELRLGVWPPLRVGGVRLERPGAWSLALEQADLRPRGPLSLLSGEARLSLGRLSGTGPGGVAFSLVPTRWDVSLARGGWNAELRGPVRGLRAAWRGAPGAGSLEVGADALPAGRLLALERGGAPLLDLGTLGGEILLARAPRADGFRVRATARGVRFAALGSEDDAVRFGAPTDVELSAGGSWRSEPAALELRRLSATFGGASLAATLSLGDLSGEPRLRISLDVPRVEFSRLLRTSGVDDPIAGMDGGDGPNAGLGSAALRASACGRLDDPASFRVEQRLDFDPPARLPAALLRLRGDFVHEVTQSDGSVRALYVSPDSPDFVALGEVPALFVRTLLLAEDAGFYGHRGIDLAELPPALFTNWQRGGAFRGGSTLTQQLAKNLFLSRRKRLSRKLQELPLALLLEAALDKQRMLEIYLNVIEWGPDLWGLRPAARHYFGIEPGALTPAQAAFLVSLVPGPVKYQTALAGGVVTAWFRSLVDDLLVKLRSVDALSESQYQAARADALRLAPAAVETARGRNPPIASTGRAPAAPGRADALGGGLEP